MKHLSFALTRSLFSPHAALITAGLLALGCAAGNEADGSEPTASFQARSAAYPLDTWTAWSMPLAVCFRAAVTDPSNPDYVDAETLTTWSGQAFSVLQSTWGRVPGVSFTQDCTASQYLTVNFYKLGGTSFCSPGVGQSCDQHGFDSVDPSQFVHEVGHGLGLAHEHQRSDAVLCPAEQTAVPIYSRCSNADAAGQPCSAADYNYIFAKSVTSPQRLTDEERRIINDWLPNNIPAPSYALLTVYDGQSIMNYCNADFGRAAGDFQPTALDLLGLEMLYPLRSSYPLKCSQGCFNTSNGVIVRSDGVVTSDWTSRGALHVPMSLGLSPGSTTIAAGALPAGTSNVSYSFWDPRGSRHTGSGVSQNSNSTHAAVVGSIVTALL